MFFPRSLLKFNFIRNFQRQHRSVSIMRGLSGQVTSNDINKKVIPLYHYIWEINKWNVSLIYRNNTLFKFNTNLH